MPALEEVTDGWKNKPRETIWALINNCSSYRKKSCELAINQKQTTLRKYEGSFVRGQGLQGPGRVSCVCCKLGETAGRISQALGRIENLCGGQWLVTDG